MEIVLATRNKSKIDQISNIFSDLDVRLLSLSDVGIEEDIVEDGFTLEENALKKAKYATLKTGKWSIADDTGLFIDILGGKPGIYAARWAGENKETEDIMNFTLDKLKGIPRNKRTALFKTVAVSVSPSFETNFFLGKLNGVLLEKPRVKCQPNMPYSAIFLPDNQKKVLAEMTTLEENRISHRGKAFKKLKKYFKENFLSSF